MLHPNSRAASQFPPHPHITKPPHPTCSLHPPMCPNIHTLGWLTIILCPNFVLRFSFNNMRVLHSRISNVNFYWQLTNLIRTWTIRRPWLIRLLRTLKWWETRCHRRTRGWGRRTRSLHYPTCPARTSHWKQDKILVKTSLTKYTNKIRMVKASFADNNTGKDKFPWNC